MHLPVRFAAVGVLILSGAPSAPSDGAPRQQPFPAPGPQQPAPPPPPPTRRFGPSPEQQAGTRADHQHLLRLLGITALRPGASGNPDAPDAANADESKAGTYTLPDPLTFKDGTRVTSARQWNRRRRAELFEEFDREVYGRVPKLTPKVAWRVKETTREARGAIPALTRKLVGHVDNRASPGIKVDIQLTLTTPENAAGPVPVVMELGFMFPTRSGAPAAAVAPPPGAGPPACGCMVGRPPRAAPSAAGR